MSKYEAFSGLYFPKYLSVFSPNAGKYGPEKTPYFGHFSSSEIVNMSDKSMKSLLN